MLVLGETFHRKTYGLSVAFRCALVMSAERSPRFTTAP